MLVMMAGLPGTGKSTVAASLVEKLAAMVLSKDIIRAALFGPKHVEYSPEQDDFCLGIMLETAAYLFRKYPAQIVILDGRTFSRVEHRQRVIDFALQQSVPLKIVECVCSEQTALARIAADAVRGIHPAGDRNAELYHRVRAHFEPIAEPKLTIDTDLPLPASLYSNFRVS